MQGEVIELTELGTLYVQKRRMARRAISSVLRSQLEAELAELEEEGVPQGRVDGRSSPQRDPAHAVSADPPVSEPRQHLDGPPCRICGGVEHGTGAHAKLVALERRHLLRLVHELVALGGPPELLEEIEGSVSRLRAALKRSDHA